MFFSDSSPCNRFLAMVIAKLIYESTDMSTEKQHMAVSENKVYTPKIVLLNGKMIIYIFSRYLENEIISRLIRCVHKIPCFLLQRRPVHKILEHRPATGVWFDGPIAFLVYQWLVMVEHGTMV